MKVGAKFHYQAYWPLLGCIGLFLSMATWAHILREPELRLYFASEATMNRCVSLLSSSSDQPWQAASISEWKILLLLGLILAGFLGGIFCLWPPEKRQKGFWQVTVWWTLGGSWSLFLNIAELFPWDELQILVQGLCELWLSFSLAGLLHVFWQSKISETSQAPLLGSPSDASSHQSEQRTILPELNTDSSLPIRTFAELPWVPLIIGVLVYTAIFGTMTQCLWNSLRVPHGDSSMYEEHLWNLLHGKGFRSFIDQGLFLGEHIQFVHLFLIPIYLIWPSHMTLEWLQSFGLAMGAFPVAALVFHFTRNRKAACWGGLAYLFSVSVQRLDLSIDFKTFRPESFGIPLLLMTLLHIEKRNWKAAGIWALLTLSVKEEYGLVFAPLGLWIAIRGRNRITECIGGLAIAALSTLYVIACVSWIIPWFRSGAEVHYTRYYTKLGGSFREILWTFIFQPQVPLAELMQASTGLFAAVLLVPVGGLALFSPSRFWVAIPLFFLLSLNEIARNADHHFHAPLVPILIWAAAAGCRNTNAIGRARWWCFAAILSGLFRGLSPLSIPFWDSGSGFYWEKRYLPDRRAVLWSELEKSLDPSMRVAATDFIHPRLTHFERSYDYSGYRKIPPDDTDLLIIDVRGPYSEVRTPEDVEIFSKEPERWKLLPNTYEGFFYLFQREK